MSLVELITSPVAITIGKYIYDGVKKWWDNRERNKEIKKNETNIRRLMEEVKNLVSKLETSKLQSEGSFEADGQDIALLKQKVVEVSHLEAVTKENLTSVEAFNTWLDNNLENKDEPVDPEEAAEFYRSRLRARISNAQELGLSPKKLTELKDLLVAINVNLRSLKETRQRAKQLGTLSFLGQAKDAEVYLETCLVDASIALKGS